MAGQTMAEADHMVGMIKATAGQTMAGLDRMGRVVKAITMIECRNAHR